MSGLDITGLGAVATAVSDIVDKFFPSADDKVKAELAVQLQVLAQQAAQDAAQAQIDNTEAASGNWYDSAWRPTCAWVCVAAFAWAYVLQPLFVFIIAEFGRAPVAMPALDLNVMLPVLFGLLGLGTMRSFDKVKGTSK